MAEHTPESWIVDDRDGEYWVLDGVYRPAPGESGEEYAEIVARCSDPDHARLIAAAPDLLEACQKALDAFGDEKLADCELSDEEAAHLEAILYLTRAIAKATGAADA